VSEQVRGGLEGEGERESPAHSLLFIIMCKICNNVGIIFRLTRFLNLFSNLFFLESMQVNEWGEGQRESDNLQNLLQTPC